MLLLVKCVMIGIGITLVFCHLGHALGLGRVKQHMDDILVDEANNDAVRSFQMIPEDETEEQLIIDTQKTFNEKHAEPIENGDADDGDESGGGDEGKLPTGELNPDKIQNKLYLRHTHNTNKAHWSNDEPIKSLKTKSDDSVETVQGNRMIDHKKYSYTSQHIHSPEDAMENGHFQTLRYSRSLHNYKNTENIMDYDRYYSGVGFNDVCISHNVTFYRHFDQAVKEVTGGIAIDNTNGHQCLCTVEETFTLCNCSNLNFYYVPKYLKDGLNGLDLSRNFIQTLDRNSFKNYESLKYLSLQHNFLGSFSVDCFHGLNDLLVLDLRWNKLTMTTGTYPIGIFKNLPSLVALRINKNTENAEDPGLSYPDQALADLKSLKFLAMDGIGSQTFGEGFERLENLETLSLSGYIDGYCRLTALSADTFKHLSQLRMLNISDCNVLGANVDKNTFAHLTNLHTLDLSWNEAMEFQNMARIIRVLNESNMKELFIQRIDSRFKSRSKIKAYYSSSLPRHLTCLVASSNSISQLEPRVMQNLPSTLRYLDFSGNRLIFGQYIEGLHSLKNLEVLKLNGYEFTFTIPHSYPQSRDDPRFMFGETKRDIPNQADTIEKTRPELIVPVPPKARIISMQYAALSYNLGPLTINEDNGLEEIYLTDNYFPKLIGPFKGFNKLKMLIMKYCEIKYIDKYFFNTFPALEFLDLNGNYIGLGTSLNYRPFLNLKYLGYLNLNFNAISHFENDSFSGLTSLKELRLSTNPFYKFNADISHMSQLEVLDLNLTAIHTLPRVTQTHLNSLQNITVFMAETPINCDCSNVGFLQWLTHSHAIPDHSDGYFCILNVRIQLTLSRTQFIKQVAIIERGCAHNYGLFLAVIGGTLALLALLIGSIMYRFRWRIRYLYYRMHLWTTKGSELGNGVAQPEENRYAYDLFISYSNDDEEFVLRKMVAGESQAVVIYRTDSPNWTIKERELHGRGLRICIHSRDFRAGENVTTNIIRAVKHSRKTLIVLTRHFLASKWCQAEFQMAKEEAVVTGRKILVFLIKDKIPKNKIGLELLTHIQRNTYIPYHHGNNDDAANNDPSSADSISMKAMWDKLVRDITT